MQHKKGSGEVSNQGSIISCQWAGCASEASKHVIYKPYMGATVTTDSRGVPISVTMRHADLCGLHVTEIQHSHGKGDVKDLGQYIAEGCPCQESR